ncbi:histidinol-phosphatase [Monocercomonoides exilis]|uniref:histidinol-phosphatase n=1 Tax=Monocercomonoides exilis TaxID=2049356 RepID=UPI003559AF0C|nr:histidinol-phosphatase [Monocercomonoides exilis]|eukprot:MONOS_8389.1-p1 / transcript=MONOS_8389.1 / gene=MONOS_8389 / organism=Monocercomonoides_exilis_PA203 / gene_product=histidinol-phosphatase / transcript_product=histidinol-phosphatase / location=Mono_scaffold00315:17967-18945(+) / protein_length=271 / sequence_SO=supercontig / SO=protein_coding / is_pseudo=false
MGLAILTITSHIPTNNDGFCEAGYEHNFCKMDIGRIDDYIAEVHETDKIAQQDDKGSVKRVYLGIESDFFHDLSTIKDGMDILETRPFDYIIGSMHHQVPIYREYLKHLGIPVGSKEADHDIIEQYFHDCKLLCESRKFDCVGHCDVIRCFKTLYDQNAFDPKSHEESIRRFLASAHAVDMPIEINTSGMRRVKEGVRSEIYPDPVILKWAKEMGVRITLGSDAHSVDVVGAEFRGRVMEVLKDVGYTTACYFEQHKRIEYPIEGLAEMK